VQGDLLAAINSGPMPGGPVLPGGSDPWGTFEAAVNLAALRMTLLGIGMFFAVYALNALPMYTSERQLAVLRRKYFAALLRQDAAYYDTHRTGEAATRMAEETLAVQEGMGEKVAQAAQYASTFVSGIVIAFTQSWKMTLGERAGAGHGAGGVQGVVLAGV
jgi:ABC-type multidrug transport system fused ATPase/permease subunit